MSYLVNYSDSSDEEEQRIKTNNAYSRPEKNDHPLNSTPTSLDVCEIKLVVGESQLETRSNNHQTNDEPVSHKKSRIQDAIESDSQSRQATITTIITSECTTSSGSVGKQNVRQQLGLPSAIQSMFTNRSSRQWTDDPNLHGSRKRSFPHEEGNWATHVFIPVRKDEKLVSFVNELLRLFEPLRFEFSSEFHMSLSRTVAIRHHWIDPLVDCLKKNFSSAKSSVGDLCDIKLYSNDEKTRTFLCVEVSKEDTSFLEYVSVVDKCFSEFKLPVYYENPSFHISVAWCLGDVCHAVPKGKLNKAKEILNSFCTANPELSVVFAKDVWCRSGNKSFTIPLIV